ncbi:MAG: phytoene/squalene synthase family protein [Acidobacteria bacterium]|nr:phytoene/squalene synthase family protein [Acidobacteriota bacterium]
MTSVAEAYEICRRITRKHGGNFSVGFRFLPPQKQHAVHAAYAYCRIADDIADEPGPVILSPEEGEGSPGAGGTAAHLPGDSSPSARLRMTRLDAWQHELDLTYAGKPTHDVTIALADALQHFAIPKSAFIALLDGCRQDMVKTRYETFDELLHYCDLVATSISDISLAIFGYKTDAALAYGRNLSTALQLTNVTRDIGDDLQRDRVYLPQEELRRFGVSERELFEGSGHGPLRLSAKPSRGSASSPTLARATTSGNVLSSENERVQALIEFQIARAEQYFRDAEPLLKELSFDARFPVLLMGGVYATVLAKLRKDPLAAVRERLRLTSLQKMLVVGRRVLRPHFV